MNAEKDILSLEVTETPDDRLFPQAVIDRLRRSLNALRFQIPGCRAPLRTIVVNDDPNLSLVRCSWYQTEDGFIATISLPLIRLLYSMFVVQEEAAPGRQAPDMAALNAAQHPRSRMFAEALALFCRDERTPPPSLRQIIEPNSSAIRRDALDDLARQIARKQNAVDGITFVPDAFFNTMVATQALLVRDYYHLASGTPLLRRIMEQQNWDIISPKTAHWCSTIDAYILMAKMISSLFAKKSSSNGFDVGETAGSVDPHHLHVRYAPNQLRIVRLLLGLIMLQESVSAERSRALTFASQRKEYRETYAALKASDDAPPLALAMAHIQEVLWRQHNPHVDDGRDVLGRHALRCICDQYVTASAEWLGDSSVLALGALPIHDLDAREAENDFLTAHMPVYRELKSAVLRML